MNVTVEYATKWNPYVGLEGTSYLNLSMVQLPVLALRHDRNTTQASKLLINFKSTSALTKALMPADSEHLQWD